MAKSFYAVMIRWDILPTEAKVSEIDATLGVLGDWLRFGGHNWLIWSESTPSQIYAALAGKLSQKDSELIVNFDPNSYSGWAPKWVDDWITQRRDGALKVISPPSPSFASLFEPKP
ncbi:hypothetical protein [Bradyrhizobium canariense]|uniref:Uncharacterized protein n=1 Tax=Bradyrhizobium canariense TaxID=255045 RepID=A0A1H1Y8Q8_9BRAD|nr:hypothetical protein [Bradyrhizobium canariense]SDT17792.1 hypothetical protein SAMN05444158_4687 [Bradyrhizobium canariense]